jgi:hypothetical protein
MKKQTAIKIFGSATALARALQITKPAISQWPDVLSQRQADEILGAALRLKKLSSKQAKHILEHERSLENTDFKNIVCCPPCSLKTVMPKEAKDLADGQRNE